MQDFISSEPQATVVKSPPPSFLLGGRTNIVEQDYRDIKRRINATLGFRSFTGAERAIQGYEAIHMIRKRQVRWLAKGDIAEQVRFIKHIFGLTT
jgi:IS6 family transposase